VHEELGLDAYAPYSGTIFDLASGELIYEASADEEESIVVELDMNRSEQVRRWWPFLRDRRIDEYTEITKRYIDQQE
jgi:predicted amidohydrolase